MHWFPLCHAGAELNVLLWSTDGEPVDATKAEAIDGHYIELDPVHPLTLSNQPIKIPDVQPKLEELNRQLAWEEDPLNESDEELVRPVVAPEPVTAVKKRKSVGGALATVDASGSSKMSTRSRGKQAQPAKVHKPFTPCGPEILQMVRMLPPPKSPNRGALLSVTKELRAMVAEQEKEGPVDCGFYFDPERSDGNVFCWIVELPVASFDQALPLVKDCKDKGVNR